MVPENSFRTRLSKIEQTRIPSHVAFICWNTWKTRCKAVIEGRLTSPIEVIYATSYAVSEFMAAKPASLDARLRSISTNQVNRTWSPPTAPKVKINMDAAWSASSKCGGIGLVSQDHLGSFHVAKAGPCRVCSFAIVTSVPKCSL
ncbi:hypothetical protein PRUPE_2G048800 [Prunus persica]|uniref:RNase H type-1 domain-containing protein n=1 Tax=Prunus persica TaxID=3760 RepID=A0A251QB62_PRUPE|nr:hypothetical protein PRUPE_2G048800 [Prunus persica]